MLSYCMIIKWEETMYFNLKRIKAWINDFCFRLKYFYLLFSICFFSCVAVPPATGGAYLYNNYEANFLTFQDQGGTLTGSSAGICYISLVCIGDTTISTAAKSSNIKRISSVEYRYNSVFFFYSKTTVIVKGF